MRQSQQEKRIREKLREQFDSASTKFENACSLIHEKGDALLEKHPEILDLVPADDGTVRAVILLTPETDRDRLYGDIGGAFGEHTGNHLLSTTNDREFLPFRRRLQQMYDDELAVLGVHCTLARQEDEMIALRVRSRHAEPQNHDAAALKTEIEKLFPELTVIIE